MIRYHRHAIAFRPLSEGIPVDAANNVAWPMQFCPTCNKVPEDGEIVGRHEDGKPPE